MSRNMRCFLGLGAASLILVAVASQPAAAGPRDKFQQPGVSPIVNTHYQAGSKFYPDGRTRPIGSAWWKTYPWSGYNAWRNPYWYPPYNNNYPFPPDQAYPYPYPAPRPYPMPQPYPTPLPWGGMGSINR